MLTCEQKDSAYYVRAAHVTERITSGFVLVSDGSRALLQTYGSGTGARTILAVILEVEKSNALEKLLSRRAMCVVDSDGDVTRRFCHTRPFD